MVKRSDAVFLGEFTSNFVFDSLVFIFVHRFSFIYAIDGVISPDGENIVSSDDSGTVCVWGQNKSITR